MALIMGIQIIGILFALSMIYYAFLNLKRKQLKRGEFALWLIVWLAFLVMSIFPMYLEKLAHTLSVYRTMDFLIIIGFLFIIMLTFYNYVQVRKNNYKIEQIIRRIAFKKANSQKKTKNER
ncbi:DUF2304 domain-containing protein [Candidatus Woesearchaeota archaeon]|nr:DUF2304 domain-containing protein [Candidatus Woesearchaeota archaeon]